LWDLGIRVQLLIERHDVIDHVCALCEFILSGGDLLRGEKTVLVKMGEQGKDEMSIQVGDNRPCEVVLGHSTLLVWRAKNEILPVTCPSDTHSPTMTTTTTTRNLPWLVKDLGISIIGQVRIFDVFTPNIPH